MQEQCTAGSPKRGAWAATARHRANLRVRCLLAPAVVDHAAAVWCFAPVAMDHAARKDAKSGMLRVLAKVWYFATFVVNHVAPSEECLARSMCLQRSWCFATFAVDHAAPSEANPGVLNVHARGVLSAPPLVDHAAPNKPCKGIIHWYGKGVHTQEDLLMQLLTGLSSKYSQMHSAVTCAGSSFIRGNCLHVCVCACVPRAFGRSLHAWVISAHHVAPDAAEVECVLWCACVVALLLLRLEHVESMRTVLSELLKLPGEDAEEEGGGMVLTPDWQICGGYGQRGNRFWQQGMLGSFLKNSPVTCSTLCCCPQSSSWKTPLLFSHVLLTLLGATMCRNPILADTPLVQPRLTHTAWCHHVQEPYLADIPAEERRLQAEMSVNDVSVEALIAHPHVQVEFTQGRHVQWARGFSYMLHRKPAAACATVVPLGTLNHALIC
eukprot:1144703-Pelagomonas_calceolata.AAC.11